MPQPTSDEALGDHVDGYGSTFYGYGSYAARWWFVGIEEGGGRSPAELGRRLEAWHRRGWQELEDLFEFHRELGVTHHFGAHARLQATWKQLARLALSAEGLEDSMHTVREYQGLRLGRKGGDSCLLELLPFPSPTVADWRHADLSRLPYLADRSRYVEHYASQRARHIGERVAEHRPSAVFFYGSSAWCLRWWTAIAGTQLRPVGDSGLCAASSSGTIYMVLKHPAARGVDNVYFRGAGQHAREESERLLA